MAIPTWSDFLRTFARIGCFSFGGPAGQIALMHRELVEERGWIAEDTYLRSLNFCHLLPGPEAQQLATYIGWRLRGWPGGLAAGMLFVLPGAAVILGLSILYVAAAGLGWFAALFLGVKAAVLAIVVQALIRIAGRALDTGLKRALALGAFVMMFAVGLDFPLVIVGAAVIGALVASRAPHMLALKPVGDAGPSRASVRGTLATAALWAAIWALPILVVVLLLGPHHILFEIGTFFAKLAAVTFGGAYAVLAYMAQEAVATHGWLTTREMADGLGLAETTPGPLVMVTQFVGFIGAYRDPAPFTPLVAGILAAGLTTWVTFAPCFLWIFALGPWIDRLEQLRPLQGALAALTAAVVGAIASLSLWFALHVLFTDMVGGWPVWTSIDWRAAALATVAGVLLFRLRWNELATLGVCAVAGLALGSIG